MEPMLDIRNLAKTFDGFALRDLSLCLPRGYIMGLIGPNGAGKTTLIKLILRLLIPDRGTIRIAGCDLGASEASLKQRIGFVHDTPRFYDFLALQTYSVIVSRFYDSWDEPRFQALARQFELPLRRRIRTLSRGMRMKFALALALAHHPEFLVLDEPTTGLDPVFRREFLDLLLEFLQDEQRAVLFSTQITSDVERIADYVTYLRNGRIVFSSLKDALRENWAVVKGGAEQLQARSHACLRAIRSGDFGVVALTDNAAAARRALPPSVLIEPVSLEEMMVLLHAADLSADAPPPHLPPGT